MQKKQTYPAAKSDLAKKPRSQALKKPSPAAEGAHTDLSEVLRQGFEALGKAELQNALRSANTVLRLQDGQNQALYLRAQVELQRRAPLKALADLERINDADLALSVAQLKGQALLSLQRLDDAFGAFQLALQLKPDDGPSHLMLATVLLAQGDQTAGYQMMRRAVLLDDTLAMGHYELGVQALGQSAFEKAYQYLSKACQLMPDWAQSLNNLALAAKCLGQNDEAAGLLERAVARDARYAEAWFNLGVVLHEMGAAAKAQRAFKQAIKLRPDLADNLPG